MDEKCEDSSLYEKTLLCPSARCKKGAILLGVVQPDGHIAFISNPITIDDDFAQLAHQGRTPEKRFRFSDTCIKSGCKQWSGNSCGVIEEVLHYVEPEDMRSFELPQCSIRPQCRWFRQRGICYRTENMS